MAVHRKKSSNDIIRQMGRLQIGLGMQRGIHRASADYTDERDRELKGRADRVLEKGRQYVNNIRERQGYGKEFWGSGYAASEADRNKKYSRASYVTAG